MSKTEIEFCFHTQTSINQFVRVVGSIAELGDWDPDKGIDLTILKGLKL